MYYVLNYSQFDNKIYQDFAKYALNPEALINPYLGLQKTILGLARSN